jgi:hypothetical protein
MNDETLKTIKAATIVASAMGIFFNHAFCLLAQQTGVDLRKLADQLRLLNKDLENQDPVFQSAYSSIRDRMILNLDKLYQ